MMEFRTCSPGALLVAAVAAVGLSSTPAGATVSTFDVDDEGWMIVGDAQGGSANPTYNSTGGNPGGHISATDDVTGGTWFFSAPEKFLGDRTGAYGTELTFDLIQDSTSSQYINTDIWLRGATLNLAFDTSYNPGRDWTSYAIAIDENAGWRVGVIGGPMATQSDIMAVLQDVRALEIRGEFRTGGDRGGLDNVVFVPEPGAAMMAMLGLPLLWRRTRAAV